MRLFDDKIIYSLNTSLPTESFKSQIDPSTTCTQLYDEVRNSHGLNNHYSIYILLPTLFQLQTNYKHRDSAIQKCISIGADRLKNLKQEHQKDFDNISLLKQLKAEQTKVTMVI